MKTTLWRIGAVASLTLTSMLLTGMSAQAQFGYYSARPIFSYWPATNVMGWTPAPTAPYGVTQVPDQPVVPVAPAAVLPQTGSSIEATMEPHGQVLLKWQGDPTTVNRIGFALLDRSGNVIKQKILTTGAPQTRFALTNKSRYYRVVVEYMTGATNTVTSLL